MIPKGAADVIVITCPHCGGDGGEWLRDEDGFGPVEWHSCYHCCEEGTFKMTEQQYLDMVNELAAEAAAEDAERQPC